MVSVVWCVFQRLPGERCPALAAVCASAEVAEALVELSRREQEEMAESPGDWMIQKWSVLRGEIRGIEQADQISHALNLMREAVADPRVGPTGREEQADDPSLQR